MKVDLASLSVRNDSSKITKNHVKVIAAAVIGDMLEFFDLFLLSFMLAFIVVPWHLSYMQTSVLILAAGVGAIIGAYFWGNMADIFGRRPIFISTILVFSIATGAMFFTPEGNWIYLTIFRVMVGFGVGGLYCVDLPLVQEFVPARYRGVASSIIIFSVGFGTFLAGMSAAHLTGLVGGWRGLFLIGLIPAAATLLVRVWVPESPRWLITKGRFSEAATSFLWSLGERKNYKRDESIEVVANPEDFPESLQQKKRLPLLEIFKYPRSVIVSCFLMLGIQTAIFGYQMWGPTIFTQILNITAPQSAAMWSMLALITCPAPIIWGFVGDKIGRRPTLVAITCIGGLLLIIGGQNSNAMLGTVSVFFIFSILAHFFVGGSMGIIGPYSAEIWPSHLRTTGLGFAYSVGNLGKIIGPASLAIFAGSSNIVSPAVTVSAVPSAWIFLALCAIIGGLVVLGGIETRGKTIVDIEKSLIRKSA